MIRKTSILALLFISLYILTNVSIADETHHQNPFGAGERLLIKLVGWSEAYTPGSGGNIDSVPNVKGDVVCHDVEMVDLQSNEVIGISTDCFSDAEPDSGGGAGFVGTTFLNFPNGTIVAQGQFTAQPVLRETTTITGVPITAITGAATDGNSIIGGTGRYKNSTGNIRISGMIDSTNYTFSAGDPLYFDCIFEIQLFDDAANGSDT